MLTVNDLELKRNGETIHPNISFALKKGEILWLKGANGSGKSSLLKAILGWLPHEGVSLAEEARLAYVGHQTGLPAHLTVWEHCALHPAILHFSPQHAHSLLARLGLASYLHRHIGTLSAGQKQRLALVPMMLSGASLWLLDEPFTALDVGGVAQVKALFNDYLLQGVSMVIVSHDDLSDMTSNTLSMGDEHA